MSQAYIKRTERNIEHVKARGSIFALLLGVSLLLPFVAHATTIGDLLDDFTFLFGTIVSLLIGVAVAVFFWGLVKFIAHADDAKAVEEGKPLMIWGMIAIFVMVALWGILGFLQYEFGLDLAPTIDTLPQQPGAIPTPL